MRRRFSPTATAGRPGQGAAAPADVLGLLAGERDGTGGSERDSAAVRTAGGWQTATKKLAGVCACSPHLLGCPPRRVSARRAATSGGWSRGLPGGRRAGRTGLQGPWRGACRSRTCRRRGAAGRQEVLSAGAWYRPLQTQGCRRKCAAAEQAERRKQPRSRRDAAPVCRLASTPCQQCTVCSFSAICAARAVLLSTWHEGETSESTQQHLRSEWHVCKAPVRYTGPPRRAPCRRIVAGGKGGTWRRRAQRKSWQALPQRWRCKCPNWHRPTHACRRCPSLPSRAQLLPHPPSGPHLGTPATSAGG